MATVAVTTSSGGRGRTHRCAAGRGASGAGTQRQASDVATGMDPELEANLICRWQDGKDEAALAALVRACLPRVEYIARRYRHYSVDHDDLVGEGHVAS